MRSQYFWNITRCQAISLVAKFHHVLGHGFMIQRVILIFINCLTASQNQLFLHESIFICFICFVKHECNKILDKLVEVFRRWGWVGTFCNYIYSHTFVNNGNISEDFKLLKQNHADTLFWLDWLFTTLLPFFWQIQFAKNVGPFFFWLETYRSSSWIIKQRDCWYP